MALGKKLSKLRKENNYTQEQLADMLSVSRQSVSKWESDIAYPETEKLIRLSTLFNISIDELIKDTPVSPKNTQDKCVAIDYSSFIGSWCNIDLKNWDSGYYTAGVIGQDDNYLSFYQTDRRKGLKYGIVLKRHIDTVSKLKMSRRKQNSLPTLPDTMPVISNPYLPLLGKACDIQVHSPNLTAFILSTDGYQKAVVISVEKNTVKIEDKGAVVILNKTDIVGITEN